MKIRRTTAAASIALMAIFVAADSSAAIKRPSAKAVTLSVWTYTATWKTGIDSAAAAYNKATGSNLQLNVQYINEANGIYASKVAAGARSHSLPDLLVAYGSPWDYVGGGLYKELTTSLGTTKSNFPPAILKGYVEYSAADKAACAANKDCTYKNLRVGQIFTVPQISGGTGFVFALKSQLAKAGITHAPSNWAGWISDMNKTEQKFGSSGGLTMPLSIPEAGLLWLFNPMLFTQLGPSGINALYNDKTGNMWESPAVKNVLSMYDQLTPLWQPGVLQNDQPGAFSALASGKATWYYGGTFSLAGLIAAGVKPSNLLVFPMPVASGGALKQFHILQWGSGFIGISRDSKDPADALAFLKWYMSPAGGEAFSKVANDQPAVKLDATISKANPLYSATKAAFSQGPDAFSDFSVYGPTCDAASTLNNQAAVALTGLLTKTYTTDTLATKLHDLYSTAWTACG